MSFYKGYAGEFEIHKAIRIGKRYKLSRCFLRKGRCCLEVLLLAIFGIATILPVHATDTLSPRDFKQESWSKTIDFFDYACTYASAHGKTPPPANWSANLYMVYINVSGFQLLYAGLVNMTTGNATLTVPVQNFLEHYRTQKGKFFIRKKNFDHSFIIL